MEDSRRLRIANLQREIFLLHREKRRIESIILETISPALREVAEAELAMLLLKIDAAEDELKRLESGL